MASFPSFLVLALIFEHDGRQWWQDDIGRAVLGKDRTLIALAAAAVRAAVDRAFFRDSMHSWQMRVVP